MVNKVTVSSKNHIVIPAEARRELGIKPGDRLYVVVRDGYMFVMPEPDDVVEELRGLHKEIWEGVDAQEYVNQERDTWQDQRVC